MGLDAGAAAAALPLITGVAAAAALAAGPAWVAIRRGGRDCPVAGSCGPARAAALRRAMRVFGALTVTLLTAAAGALLLRLAGAAVPGSAAAPRLDRLTMLSLPGGAAGGLLWLMLWVSAIRAEGPGWPRRIAADIGQALHWASLLVLAAGPALGGAAILRLSAEARAVDLSWVMLSAPGYLAYSIGGCGLIAMPLLALSRVLVRFAPQPARRTG
jgi:hypothetical protein